MYPCYRDLLDLTEKPPIWWLNGVPRWCAFAPAEVSPYAREVALVLVRSQTTGTAYTVAIEHRPQPSLDLSSKPSLADTIPGGWVPYGDPPNDGEDHEGATMTALQIEVIEYWRRNASLAWERDASLEVALQDHPKGPNTH